MVDCWVEVAGDRLDDTSAAYRSGSPTVLAGLSILWGRETTVDQPTPATCTLTVHDPTGGTGFVDRIGIGDPIDVFASGDVSTGAPTNIVIGPGFEDLATGPPGLRVSQPQTADPGTPTVTAAVVHAGVRALRLTIGDAAGAVVYVPPDDHDLANPAAWDAIPRIQNDQVWPWHGWVKAGPGVVAWLSAYLFADPADTTPVSGSTAITLDGGPSGSDWQLLGRDDIRVQANSTGHWQGIGMRVQSVYTYATVPADITYDTAIGSYQDWGSAWVDDVDVMVPASGVPRVALVFSGRVTDLVARPGDPLEVDVTAVDQMADLENRYIGASPWAAETVTARIARIVTAAGIDVEQRVDTVPGNRTISKRDVDRRPAGELLTALAAGLDAILWSATHASTGPYLWLEDPGARAQLGQLELSGGMVRITGAQTSNRSPGRTIVDGCVIARDPVEVVRDVADVATRVDLTWLEQTTTPTERREQVVDLAAESLYGARRYGMATQLTSANEAIEVGNRVLTRLAALAWRVRDLTWDATIFPPAPGLATADLLDLLDGTVRIGRGVIVDNVDGWIDETIAGYLDGGRYLFDGSGWTLEMVITPMIGQGASATYAELDPAWSYAQFDPTIRYCDLWGVAA
jgi:hypothetical protein